MEKRLTTGSFLFPLLLFLLLPGCHRTVPPEVASVQGLIAEGNLAQAEEGFDRLPEKLKKKHLDLLYGIAVAAMSNAT